MNWLLTNKNKRLTPENSKELEYIKKQVADSPWRQIFHIQPESGLLNDPNGFAFLMANIICFTNGIHLVRCMG
ncbi:hypothetical protein [Sinobaca sp. H24]|uniref:hypothetical protein n=1 Tax=Sinobaca sp. H24 TaxID=2923376 RepID=UPI00207A3DA1|nr:hypothetical protein [Sinobaca sp. H24]